MCDNNIKQMMLVIGANYLDLRRILIDIQSPDNHLGNIREIYGVFKIGNCNRLLDG